MRSLYFALKVRRFEVVVGSAVGTLGAATTRTGRIAGEISDPESGEGSICEGITIGSFSCVLKCKLQPVGCLTLIGAEGRPCRHHAHGAGWHRPGGDLVVPDNISLLPSPPYSPELNPFENIWQYSRQNYLANRVFDTYGATLDACCEALNALVGLPDTLRSIATRDWARDVSA